MTKRLSRYNTTLLIEQNISSLIGKKINIVMHDGRVFYVILNKFEHGRLFFQNMRLKKQDVGLEDIAEIIMDY